MTEQITIHQISALSAIIPLVVALLRWKHFDAAQKVMSVMVTLSLTFDLIMHLQAVRQQNNLMIGHIFLIIQTAMFCLFFLKIPDLEKRYKKSLLTYSLLAILLSIIFAFVFHQNGGINKPLLTFSSVVTILLSFLYFYDLLLHGLHIPIWKSSIFFIVSGLLMYNVSNTGLYLTFDYFEPEVASQLWIFRSMGYIFLNILLAIAFYIHNRFALNE